MYVVDDFPQVVGHVLERLVTQDPGVADADVEPAEAVDRSLDHALGMRLVGHRAVVGDRLPARIADLLHDAVGHRRPGAGTVPGPAQIVDHHTSAFLGQQQGVGTPQTTPGAGHERDLAVQHAHGILPS